MKHLFVTGLLLLPNFVFGAGLGRCSTTVWAGTLTFNFSENAEGTPLRSRQCLDSQVIVKQSSVHEDAFDGSLEVTLVLQCSDGFKKVTTSYYQTKGNELYTPSYDDLSGRPTVAFAGHFALKADGQLASLDQRIAKDDNTNDFSATASQPNADLTVRKERRSYSFGEYDLTEGTLQFVGHQIGSCLH